MIRLLLALAALLLAPAASPPARHSVDAPEAAYVATVDATDLPGTKGWFMVPYYAERDGWVRVEARYKQVTPDTAPWGHAVLVAFGDQAYTLSALALGGYQMVDASLAGHSATCCLQLSKERSETESRTSTMSGPVTSARPLFVGLAAVGWGEGSKLRITIESNVPLLQGAPLSGDRAEVVDLVRAANDAGTTLRVGGTRMIGTPGAAEREWQNEGSGVLVAIITARGDSAARLSVNDEEPVHARESDASFTQIGPGTSRVKLDELQTPEWSPDSDRRSYVIASALYADVGVRMSGHASNHGAHDDW